MAKGVVQHILDHEIIETENSKTLIFLDSSDYMRNPESPRLQITLPGYDKFFLVNYIAGKVNTFNSSTIGLNEVFNESHLIDLPDGVWVIKQEICPYDKVYVIKKHMRMTLLNERLKSLYRHIDLSRCQVQQDKKIQMDLIDIYSLMKGAKAEVNRDSSVAYDYYQLANKLVRRLSDKLCKACK